MSCSWENRVLGIMVHSVALEFVGTAVSSCRLDARETLAQHDLIPLGHHGSEKDAVGTADSLQADRFPGENRRAEAHIERAEARGVEGAHRSHQQISGNPVRAEPVQYRAIEPGFGAC